MKVATKSRKKSSPIKRSDRVDARASSTPQIIAGAATDQECDRVATLFHLLAAAWIAAMLLVGHFAPDRYHMLMQEDRLVEWGTVWLFLAAGLINLRHAIRSRRIFDGLVALFCLFIAGEEFSWGQASAGVLPAGILLGEQLPTRSKYPQSARVIPQA